MSKADRRRSAAADRRHDQDLSSLLETCRQIGALAADEDVDVTPNARRRVANAVAYSRPTEVQRVDRFTDRRSRHVRPPRASREEPRENGGKQDRDRLGDG